MVLFRPISIVTTPHWRSTTLRLQERPMFQSAFLEWTNIASEAGSFVA
jgi:hypothetical protein